MNSVEFAVELTVPDNTAFTVLTALRGLGYRELDRVERNDLYLLGIREGLSPQECARALTHAEIVFNPNKHRLAFAVGGDSDEFEAIVTDRDDDTSALTDLLVARFGMVGLETIKRSAAWRLYEGRVSAPRERLNWACEALLANANSQSYVVRKRPVYKIA